jgi:hypothetical protein
LTKGMMHYRKAWNGRTTLVRLKTNLPN